jgi:hypothetical protein
VAPGISTKTKRTLSASSPAWTASRYDHTCLRLIRVEGPRCRYSAQEHCKRRLLGTAVIGSGSSTSLGRGDHMRAAGNARWRVAPSQASHSLFAMTCMGQMAYRRAVHFMASAIIGRQEHLKCLGSRDFRCPNETEACVIESNLRRFEMRRIPQRRADNPDFLSSIRRESLYPAELSGREGQA